MRADLDIRLVSYGTGASTLRELGLPVIDLGVEDFCPAMPINVRAARWVGILRPDLVVSHEEFVALPAAKIYAVPTLYITDWFEEEAAFSSECLLFANSVIFIGDEGLFTEPAWVKGRVRYVGPILRDFRFRRQHRDVARAELGLAERQTMLLVAPGSWREDRVSIIDHVVEAYESLDPNARRLVWLAGADAEDLKARFDSDPNVEIVEFLEEIDRLYVAADFIVTKGSRKTLVELEALGLRAVALFSRSRQLNPIDIQYADSKDHVEVVNLDEPSAGARLREHFRSAPAPKPRPRSEQAIQDGLKQTVRHICEMLGE